MFKKQHSVQFKYFEFFYDNFFNPDNEYLIDKPAIGKKISKEKENYITALYFILLDLETREQTKEVKEKLQTIYKICNTTIKNYEIIYKRYSDYIIYPPHIDFNNMSYDLLFLLIEKGKKAQAKISEKRENWYKIHNTALKKQEGKYARLFDSINNDLDNFKLIIGILPRFSELKRQSKVHETISQYIATNLDEVFVVMGLDGDFNLNRLERYVMQITESRANPIIILNKLDTVDNYQEKVQLVKQRLEDVPVIVTSVTMKTNLNKIKDRFYEGMTATLVG